MTQEAILRRHERLSFQVVLSVFWSWFWRYSLWGLVPSLCVAAVLAGSTFDKANQVWIAGIPFLSIAWQLFSILLALRRALEIHSREIGKSVEQPNSVQPACNSETDRSVA